MIKSILMRNIIRNYTIQLPKDHHSIYVKPKLSQFGHAIYNTFIISFITYIGLNVLWTHLESNDVKNSLELKSQNLESQIQNVVNLKNEELKANELKYNGHWYKKLKFW
ncbi:unnamed protein product [Candida verbasci]|uniref:Uncharacterized protein n=1 Tax=Candida verbasci TaxID=1227364 RepID=A0A9W4XHW9_9ASCO|nr:unnamed protein product [Candida verbasci]